MVKVKLLVSRAGPGIVQNAGDVVEVSAPEAERIIAAGQAEPLRDGPAPERAVARRKAEKAAK